MSSEKSSPDRPLRKCDERFSLSPTEETATFHTSKKNPVQRAHVAICVSHKFVTKKVTEKSDHADPFPQVCRGFKLRWPAVDQDSRSDLVIL